MKKYIYGLWIMLAAVIFAACQDEIEQTGSNVKEGLPAKLKLSIKVPSADKVVSSRGIYDYESEVKELALIMFEESGRKVFLDLTGKLTHKAYTQNGTETDALTDTGGRIYTLSEDIEGDDLSGDYTLYAIANWSSPFCGLTTAELQAMSESKLNSALAANANFVTQITGDERLPMTYKSGEHAVAIEPLSEDAEGTELSISLRRITSHIIFEFKNGSGGKLEEENVKFVPTSYTVYNLPKNANLICKGNSEEGLNILTSNDYSNSASIATTGTSLEFFMLENVQENKTITEYADRDKWEGTNEDETKIFTNAPSGATYIVVKGEYSSDKYFGEVSYTIHLGNFGEKSYSNSKPGNGNFTVNRNEKHTYTVTVIGVNSIVTEVTNQQEEQPGPEGTISKISEGSNFVLDAHYETIMLKFPKDAKLGRSIIAVKTPFDNGTYTSEQTGGDYNWVHFMKPESTSAFPNYSTESACDIKEFAQELFTLSENGTNSNPHYIEVVEDGTTYLYTAVFVDEYFYSDKDWPEFVDQDNRIIILNPEAKTSPDKNSTYNADYIFQIAQRSIKTTYTHDGSINAFGIETWNETGRGQFDPNSLSGTVTEDSDGNYKSFGYQNTTTLLGTSWSVNKTTAGYFTSPSTNSENDHYFSGVVTKDEDGNITAYNEVYNGYNACLTRNRDENGNGTIDSEELKWYLPALEQYTTIWMGRDKLLGDTQLFSNEKMDDLSNTEADLYYWNKVNLWTSSSGIYKVYWPAEGASYGKNGTSLGIRCVRNLVEREGQIAEITSIDKINDRIIKVNGASELSMRRTSMTGEYAEHTERSDENKLYSAFEVAKYVIGQTTEAETRYFYEETSGYLGGYWVRLKAVNTDKEYEFAIQVTTDGEISFYTAEGPTNGTSLSASTTIDAVKKTKTCTADNGVSIVISTERTFTEYSYGKGYKVTLSVEKQDGYTYYFNGAAAAMTNLVTVTSDAGDVTYFTVDDIKGNNLCAANYSQEEDQSDLGQWRVPNQRELMLMVQYDFMPNASASFAYASRTFFTKATELSKPYPFTYIGHITLQPDTDSFVIRCVRDATSTSGQSTLNYLSGQSGSSYGAGSSLF